MQDTARDITVLGAGIVGVSTSLHLQQRGWDVTLIDRGSPGQATSFGNAGVICPASMVPMNSPDLHLQLASLIGNGTGALRYNVRYLASHLGWLLAFLQASKTRAARETSLALHELTSRALDEHKALMQRAGNMNRLSEGEWLKLYRRQPHANSSAFFDELMQECGMQTTTLDPNAIRELEPALKPIFAQGKLLPGCGFVNNPGALVSEYAQQFVSDGGSLIHSDITAVTDSHDGYRLESASGALSASRLVIAAGPWSADVLDTLSLKVPLAIERGYHAHYTLQPESEALGRSVHDVDGAYIMGPMEQGLRVTTGVDLNHRDAPSNLTQLKLAEPRVREAIKLGEQTTQPIWRGARPTLPDSRPMIGAVPGRPSLWVNFGHQHIGLMTGPICGRLLAQSISGEPEEVNLQPFNPARWIQDRTRRKSMFGR